MNQSSPSDAPIVKLFLTPRLSALWFERHGFVLPERRGWPFRITLDYLEPGEAWDALTLGAERFADEGS
jgi:hypothetical protein